MHRYALNVTYNGSRFHGWQKIKNSPNVHSIQGVVEQQLREITGYSGCSVYASGRTDTGVHAVHQWIHADLQYMNKDIKMSNVLEGWKKFCRLQRDVLAKHSRFVRRKDYASNSHKVGRRSRHDEVVQESLVRPQCMFETDEALPTLCGVRRLPIPPPACFIAASAAIDVVKDKSKYQFSYGRLCVFGVPGVHSIHCELLDAAVKRINNERVKDFDVCTCVGCIGSVGKHALQAQSNTAFIPNKHIFLPGIRSLPNEKIIIRMFNDAADRLGYGQDLHLTSAVRMPGFHARFHAVKRRYVYRVLISREGDLFEKGRVWSIAADKSGFDMDRAAAAAAALTGRQDFSSFRSQQCQAKSPVRTLESITLAWEPSFRERLSGLPLGASFGSSAPGLGLEPEHTANNYVYTSLFGYRGKLGADFLTEGPNSPVSSVSAGEYGLKQSEAEVVNAFLQKHSLQLQPASIPSLPSRSSELLSSRCTEGSVLTVALQSRSFQHSQVRVQVGAIVAAGFGDYPVEDIPKLLALRSRAENPVQTAPPDGLFLTNIEYPSGAEKEQYNDVFQLETDLLQCYKDKIAMQQSEKRLFTEE